MARPSGTKNIKTPQKMWEIFCAYKQKVKSNPIIVEDWVGGIGKKVRRKKERPLTLEGFENYCFEENIITDISDYIENKQGRYSDFVPICSRIRKIIREEQITGGMAGIYNPSITQRLNGLTEKIQDDGTKEIKITVTRGNRHKTE
jgi:uncharacterized protein YeeX (DUF496 family)